MLADRAYFVFLALLPFVLGSLALVVPGHTGLGRASSSSSSPQQAAQLLILLNIAVVFMGTALTIRDLVGERAIFRREQAVGLSASAYLAAKFVVYALAAAIQTAVLLVIVVAGQGGPTQGAVLLGSPVLELYVALTATAIASAVLGLLLSSLARSTEQILPMLVVTIMLSIVFAGGMIPVTGRIGLTQLSWLLPARWGYAATASTIDLLKASPLETNKDQLWFHEARWWLLDMAALVVLTLAYGAALRWRLRLPRLRATVARPVPGAAAPGAPTDTGPRPAAAAGKERSAVRWAAVIGIVAVIALVLTGLSVITRDSGTRKVSVGASWESDDDKPAKKKGHGKKDKKSKKDKSHRKHHGRSKKRVLPPVTKATVDSAERKADAIARRKPQSFTRASDTYLFKGSGSLGDPQVGDARVSFIALSPGGTVTLFGQLDGGQVVPYVLPKDEGKLFRAELGTRDQAIAQMRAEHKAIGWVLRVVGFAMMWFGLMLFFGPINALLDIVPFLGSAGRFLIGIAMFPVALVLSTVTIILSIIAHSPILLALFIVALTAGAYFLYQKKKKAG